ncbi:MAG: 1,2-phenylacetyl-CoA epoxidase subunit PaaC [Pseudomonadota bacterium]
MSTALQTYVSRLGDNALILAQRMIEQVAAYPELEEELANANFALDYLGQARLFYSYAAELEGEGRTEDDFAFLRGEREFQNFLLLEQPVRHFGDAIVKSVLFEQYYLSLLERLSACGEPRVAEIAARAAKEVTYHLRHNGQWLVRLGDGTEESHSRVQDSVNSFWPFTGELFECDDVDRTFVDAHGGPNPASLRDDWTTDIAALLADATLAMPADTWMATGGKAGKHSESFGYLLAEMQYLQRSHPGAAW